MPEPLIVPLPPDLRLTDGCVIRVTALNPTTGAVVSGVVVSNVTIEIEDVGGGPRTSIGTAPLIRTG